MNNISAISWRDQVKFQCDYHGLVDQYASYHFVALARLNNCIHVALLAHIMLILNQLVFAIASKCYVISGEASSTINYIIFGSTQPRIELMFYRILNKHSTNYTADAEVKMKNLVSYKYN